jgi:heterodisulfide reductase subunit A-like polyferredoxin
MPSIGTSSNNNNTLTSTMEREPSTGISILVVGGGIAGFTLAIEAYRKGHDVRVVERRPQGEYSGTAHQVTSQAYLLTHPTKVRSS